MTVAQNGLLPIFIIHNSLFTIRDPLCDEVFRPDNGPCLRDEARRHTLLLKPNA